MLLDSASLVNISDENEFSSKCMESLEDRKCPYPRHWSNFSRSSTSIPFYRFQTFNDLQSKRFMPLISMRSRGKVQLFRCKFVGEEKSDPLDYMRSLQLGNVS